MSINNYNPEPDKMQADIDFQQARRERCLRLKLESLAKNERDPKEREKKRTEAIEEFIKKKNEFLTMKPEDFKK